MNIHEKKCSAQVDDSRSLGLVNIYRLPEARGNIYLVDVADETRDKSNSK